MRIPRIVMTMLVFLVLFVTLMINIFYLQVIRGGKIAREAATMRDRQIELKEYRRGEIMDRNLLPLTSSISSNAVYCLPGVIGREYKERVAVTTLKPGKATKESAYRNVARFLTNISINKSEQEILDNLNQADMQGIPFVRIASDLNTGQVEKINSSQISGLVVAPIIKRYREDGFCAHLLGYVTGNGQGEGRSGLERSYNEILNKNPSSQELVSVLDARGMAIRGLMFKVRNQEDQNQGSVVLTIDKRVQEIVEKSMNKMVRKGAVVVMDVKSKEVLAMASRPTFNPYKVGEIINYDENSTLVNRALSCYYPGSLFKILLSAAALEEKVVSPDEKFNCNGKYIFNDKVAISCWKEEGHGQLTFSQAFAYSCNPCFIAVGLHLGREKLIKYVEEAHLTDQTLVGYNGYSADSYIKIDGGEPALGNASIGQRGVMLTPLQLTSLLATIADDGRWSPPVLVQYTVNDKGQRCILPRGNGKQVISVATARVVQGLLEKVVREGTGKTAALAEVRVAGKTATSQTGNKKDNRDEVLNAWFGGYFPTNKPRWAIVVLVEAGTSGAQDAAPVFKEIARGMLTYFSTSN